MTDRLILALAVLALFLLLSWLPTHWQTAKRLRNERDNDAVDFIFKLILADIWLIAFLAWVPLNRIYGGGPISDWFLIAIGVVLNGRLILFRYRRWKRHRKDKCDG